jgi:GTPase SAR1 family protein
MNAASLETVSTKLEFLHEDVTELKVVLKESVKEMSSAISKLVALEERQMQDRKAVERSFEHADKALTTAEDVSKRVYELEKQMSAASEISGWVKGAIAFILLAVGEYFMNQFGLR